MLSLSSLLNPAPSGPMTVPTRPSSASMPSPGCAKAGPKGDVIFPPFDSDRLDAATLAEVRRFEVAPLGHIGSSCRHIPYNSGKKDFFEKTGRESFEVFSYTFGHDGARYEIMWDYNVGLVRMTPFFKCCKYAKTTPAKMLNLNAGLRDITHSITGGSIVAQGYWMPFDCARAVCATFCYHMAAALVPIFGPKFPADCVPPGTPKHGQMVIDPALVLSCKRQADRFRHKYMARAVAARAPQDGRHAGYPPRHAGPGARPSLVRRPGLPVNSYHSDPGYQHDPNAIRSYHKALLMEGPWSSETDHGYRSPPRAVGHHQWPPSSGWTAANHGRDAGQHAHHHQQRQQQHRPPSSLVLPNGANPYLSAVPRFPTAPTSAAGTSSSMAANPRTPLPSPTAVASLRQHVGHAASASWHGEEPRRCKRSADAMAAEDEDLDGRSNSSSSSSRMSRTGTTSPDQKRTAPTTGSSAQDPQPGRVRRRAGNVSSTSSSSSSSSSGSDWDSDPARERDMRLAHAAARALSSSQRMLSARDGDENGNGNEIENNETCPSVTTAKTTTACGVDKSAALLLMNLSVTDPRRDVVVMRGGGGCHEQTREEGHGDGHAHRSKRRRATSL